MIDVGIVHGSEAQAVPLVVGTDVVYVHTDIKEVQDEIRTEKLYQYHEVQYGKDEYIQMLAAKNNALEAELTNTQMALCEVYELLS